MAQNVPTTQEIKDQNVANYELALNQNVPLTEKAFLRVQSALNAMNFTQLYKFGVDAAKQNLALTAIGSKLDEIGENYSLLRKIAVSAVLEATLPANNGTVVEVAIDLVGDSNQERYFNDAQVIATGGQAVLSVVAENAGVSGNLNNGEILSLSTPVAGAESKAPVTDTLTLGTEKETDDEYRVRILDKIRSEGGGGNSSDYRNWAEETAGVARAYPFAGRPLADPTAPPPARTVFIEASSTIDPDGLAPAPLLAAARLSITTDPETGVNRQPLGLTDDTLYVASIVRTAFFVEVRNLDIAVDQEAQVKADILSALTLYFAGLEPFVDGLDPAFARNDLITDLTVSNIVQDVLSAAGGSATGVGFATTPSVFISTYRLLPSEKGKIGSVTYA